MKHSIFNLSLLFLVSGCEIPHTNIDGDNALCNVYNEERREIILCPSLGTVDLSIGNIDMSGELTLRFLATNEEGAFEFQNSILNISSLQIADNNTSYISITPILTGSTKVILNGGEINLSMTIIE